MGSSFSKIAKSSVMVVPAVLDHGSLVNAKVLTVAGSYESREKRGKTASMNLKMDGAGESPTSGHVAEISSSFLEEGTFCFLLELDV